MSDAIEVEAVTIEDELAPLSRLDKLIGSITEDAATIAEQYHPHLVSTPEEFSQSKRERTGARKAITALKGRYNDLMGDLKELVRDADGRMREALRPLDAIDAGYKRENDAYMERWRTARLDDLRETYEDAAPDLALPQEGEQREMLPFRVLVDKFASTDPKKWLLAGTNVEVARDELMGHLADIAEAERSIDAMVAEEDRHEVKAHYFATLDLEGALKVAAERRERRERMERLEEERRRRAEEAEAWNRQREEILAEPEPEDVVRIVAPPEAVEETEDDWPPESYQPEHDVPYPAPPAPPAPPVPPAPPTPEPTEPAHPWVIVVPSMTRSQALELRDWLNGIGVTGGKVYAGTLAQAYAKEVGNERARTV